MKQKILLVVAVLVGIFVAVLVWRSIMPQSAPGGEPERISAEVSQAIAAAKCPAPDEALCKFLAGWAVTTEYKVVATQKTNSLTIPYEYWAEKNAYRLKTTVQGKPYEFISIADTLYTKNDEFGWWWVHRKVPTLQLNYKDSQFSYDFPAATVAYAKNGEERCGTEQCVKYKLVQVAKLEYMLWIDTSAFVLRRLDIASTNDNIEQAFTYPRVSIKAPESRRELPANQYIPPKADTPVNLPDLTIPSLP